MCRVVGFWDFGVCRYEIESVIVDMRDTMVHGGPDDAGIYVDSNVNMALGNRRLSILDLSPMGHQPMEFDGLVIVHNGEVYNFKEIRQELELLGYRFTSNSDTEVILKSFHKWGKSAVGKFRGMWAFAIWDKKGKKLTLCRDRIGVKPLYWYFKDGLFMFSSELKAFHEHPKFKKELSPDGLSLYLQYGYITAPFSIFRHTQKLLPGHFLTVDSKGNINISRYWDIRDYFLTREERMWDRKREEEVVEELENILTESFKLRMVSDVPVGMFLSGGIDSSLVTAILQKEYTKPLKTFTIGFYEKEYNEAKWARRVADYLGTDHTELHCTSRDAFYVIPKLPKLYDEPFGDSSAIPTFLVSRLARQRVKVSLSADGGDEQFFGYNRYMVMQKLKLIKKLCIPAWIVKVLTPEFAYSIYNLFEGILPEIQDFKSRFVKFKRLIELPTVQCMYDHLVKMMTNSELEKIGLNSIVSNTFKLRNDFRDADRDMMLYDLLTYLPDDILVKVDRATMGVSLEGRDPLLDNRILEYSSQIPMKFKFKGGKGKYILRKILYKYIPEELVNRPKHGFGVPVREWFRGDLKDLYLEYFKESRIIREGIFNPGVVREMLDGYLNGRLRNYAAMWNLFVFELWNERWMGL